MNIEEMKMVVDLIRQLSGDASNVALWYFGMKFAESMIILFVLVGAITWVAHQIIKTAMAQDEEFIKECRDALRIGCRGGLIGPERQATYRLIRALIAEKTKQ